MATNQTKDTSWVTKAIDDFVRYGEAVKKKFVKKSVHKRKGEKTTRTLKQDKKDSQDTTSSYYNRTYVPVKEDVLKSKMIEYKRDKERQTNQSWSSPDEIKSAAIKEHKGPVCPYCSSVAEIRTAKEHTGKDASYCYWVCPSCINVSVTTSGKSYYPSGNLADASTRRMRGELQKLLMDKKKELKYDRFALSEWIQNVLKVYPEQAWVGRLSKEQMKELAKESQKELFKQNFGYIFKLNE